MKNVSARTFLLYDGIGAIISTLFLGIILVRLQPYIGMPVHILYVLAGIAAVFMVYSLSSYFFAKKNHAVLLKIIAYCNAVYALLSLGMLIYFYDQLTWIGLAYFIIEIIILIVLVRKELHVVTTEI